MLEIKNQKIIQATPNNFEWPLWETDKARIKQNTLQFQNTPIEEAFNLIYGTTIHLSESISEVINNTPTDAKVGDIISVKLLGVNKDNVVIGLGNVKENIVCRNNLYKYGKFRGNFEPVDLKVKIVSVDKKQTVVDIMEPLYEQWRNEVINYPQWQNNMDEDQSTVIKDLHLIKGGYICKVDIPVIHKFLGEPYYVDAFIPGSQIVLNIEKDFEKWEGKAVRGFVTNFMPSPSNPLKLVAVCSVKRYLQHIGNLNMYNLFCHYVEGQGGTDFWKEFVKKPISGVVTGIINSSEKCGVFVEIPEYHMTGMILMKSNEIVKYAPKTQILVNMIGFNLPSYYNDVMEQVQHYSPYILDTNNKDQRIMVKCDLKPILKLAE